MLRSLFFAALLSLSTVAHADFSGRVVSIADGDTITVLRDRTEVRVRLAEIDAPERRQPFGTAARKALSARVFGKTVRVAESGVDRYGRVLGTVYVAGININAAMVQDGFAWAYVRYVQDRSYFRLEAKARAAKRGLWASPDAVPPWTFRRQPTTRE